MFRQTMFAATMATLVAVTVHAQPGNGQTQNPALQFYEDFSTNKNSWLVNQTSQYAFQMNNGWYRMQSKAGGSWYSSIPVPGNLTGDFEIKATFRKIAGTDAYYFGMILGKSLQTGYYHLVGITGAGHAVVANKGARPEDIISGRINEAVNKGNATNTLALRKKDGQFSFFVNEKLIGTAKAEPFFGNYFGFQIWSGNESLTVEADDLVIRTLPVSATTNGSFCAELEVVLRAVQNGNLGDVVDYKRPTDFTNSWYAGKVSLGPFTNLKGQNLLGNLSFIGWLAGSNVPDKKQLYDTWIRTLENCLTDYKKVPDPYAKGSYMFRHRKLERMTVHLEYGDPDARIRIEVSN